MRHKENSERLEWLQIHVDCTSLGNIDDCLIYRISLICHLCDDTLSLCVVTDTDAGEKLTFNSATNTMGPRKFLHHGTFRKVCNLSNLDKIFFEIILK